MNLRKNLGRVASTIVATALLASVATVPAFAYDGVTSGNETTPVGTINIGKTVVTDGNSYAPNATYNFKVENGGAGTFTYQPDSGDSITEDVLAGIGGVTAGNTTSSANTDQNPSGEYVLSDAQLTINASTFATVAPGIYHYVVTETPGDVEGMTYDDSVYDLYLYVVNGATDEADHYVQHAVAVKRVDGTGEQEGQKVPGTTKTDIDFVNDYGKDNGELHDVTIEKVVEGDLGDHNKVYTFEVTVTGDENEAFRIEYKVDGETAAQYVFITTGATLSEDIGIKETGYIKIYGLSENDKYTVTETGAEDYETEIDTDKASTEDKIVEGKESGTLTMGNEDNTIVFTNTKTSVTPTGIVMNVAPYALLVVVAVAGCFVFLRKRNED